MGDGDTASEVNHSYMPGEQLPDATRCMLVKGPIASLEGVLRETRYKDADDGLALSRPKSLSATGGYKPLQRRSQTPCEGRSREPWVVVHPMIDVGCPRTHRMVT
jgi:hypothetical protein